MNIAIIAYYFPESTIVLARHLVSLGHTVSYYYITDKNTTGTAGYDYNNANKNLGLVPLERKDNPELYNYFDNSNKINLSLIRLYNNSFGKKWKFINQYLAKRVIRKILNKNNFDVVNLVGHHPLFKSTFKLFKKEKIVNTIHEVEYHASNTNPFLPLFNSLYKRNIPIIVHSKAIYNKLIKMCGDNSNVHVVPFGLFDIYKQYDIDMPAVWDFEHDTNTEYILHYGFISAYKGIDILIEAFDKIKDNIPNVKLIIAGGGTINNKENIDTSRIILINRFLSNAEIVKLNKLAKFVVCPYLSASQSGIPMVTFLFNKPIIATKVGGFTEVIEDSENGMLIEPGSVEQLSDVILRVINNKELYEKLLDGVNTFVHSEKMSWELFAKQTESIYKA